MKELESGDADWKEKVRWWDYALCFSIPLAYTLQCYPALLNLNLQQLWFVPQGRSLASSLLPSPLGGSSWSISWVWAAPAHQPAAVSATAVVLWWWLKVPSKRLTHSVPSSWTQNTCLWGLPKWELWQLCSAVICSDLDISETCPTSKSQSKAWASWQEWLPTHRQSPCWPWGLGKEVLLSWVNSFPFLGLRGLFALV